MTFDFPHMIATAVVIFIAIWAVNNLSAFDGMTKGRRALIQAAIIFVVILALNLVWPYGATA